MTEFGDLATLPPTCWILADDTVFGWVPRHREANLPRGTWNEKGLNWNRHFFLKAKRRVPAFQEEATWRPKGHAWDLLGQDHTDLGHLSLAGDYSHPPALHFLSEPAGTTSIRMLPQPFCPAGLLQGPRRTGEFQRLPTCKWLH